MENTSDKDIGRQVEEIQKVYSKSKRAVDQNIQNIKSKYKTFDIYNPNHYVQLIESDIPEDDKHMISYLYQKRKELYRKLLIAAIIFNAVLLIWILS